MLRRSRRIARLLLVAFSSVSVLAVNAEASQLIDDFTGTGGVLGIGTIITDLGNTAFVNPLCCGGIFEYAGTASGWALTYSTFPVVNLTLGGDAAFEIDVRDIIPEAGPTMVTITASNMLAGTSSVTLPILLHEGSNPISYSSFVGTADFSSLTGLQFAFQSTKAFGMQLNGIQTIPEPGTAMMLGLGLLGLACAGRHRSRSR